MRSFVSEVPLKRDSREQRKPPFANPVTILSIYLQGYFAHKKIPDPLGPP